MRTRFDENDPTTDLMERRWFAMNSAAARLREECDTLADVLEMAESAWRGARLRLENLEAMRDALGEELARCHGEAERQAANFAAAVTSAA